MKKLEYNIVVYAEDPIALEALAMVLSDLLKNPPSAADSDRPAFTADPMSTRFRISDEKES